MMGEAWLTVVVQGVKLIALEAPPHSALTMRCCTLQRPGFKPYLCRPMMHVFFTSFIYSTHCDLVSLHCPVQKGKKAHSNKHKSIYMEYKNKLDSVNSFPQNNPYPSLFQKQHMQSNPSTAK